MANKTQNCPGVGTEYEILVPALFALKLHNQKDVKDFTIQSNVPKGFGKMDDVIIDIDLENGNSLHFAFQLKHKESKSKILPPTNLEAQGDFCLEKYWEAFQKIPKESQPKNRYDFILYTNVNFNKDNKRKEEMVKFTMTEDDEYVGKTYFETSNDATNIYKFEVKDDSLSDYNSFLSRFRLFACQKYFTAFEDEISKILKENENATFYYIDLFKKWHQGRFTNKKIDKKTISFHLLNAFASSNIITGYQISEGFELFEEAINEFDVTVIDDSKEILHSKNFTTCKNVGSFSLSEASKNNFEQYKNRYKILTLSECLLQLAKEYKVIEKATNRIDVVTEMKIFSYFIQHLLLIDFDENSRELLYELLPQMKEDTMRFVLIGKVNSVDVPKCETLRQSRFYKNLKLRNKSQYDEFISGRIYINGREVPWEQIIGYSLRFKPLKVFHTLEDLKLKNESLYQKMIQMCTLSLQGRKDITLEQFIGEYEEVLLLCCCKTVLQMLKTGFSIGEPMSDLPAYYVPRTLSTSIFDLQEIIELAEKDESIIIIILCHKIRQILDPITMKGVELVENSEFFKRPNIFVRKRMPLLITSKEYSKILISDLEGQLKRLARHQPVYVMKMISLSELILIKIMPRSSSKFPLTSSKTLEIREADAFSMLDGPLNILIAEPGMGKSTMMKYLTRNCPWKYWVINIALKDHDTYFQAIQRYPHELVKYFTTNETKMNAIWWEWISAFEDQQRIIFFFDGFDEISNSCVSGVLMAIDFLCRMGFPVWVSSRANVQKEIFSWFKIFSIGIVELSKSEQKRYVEDRLAETYNDDDIQKILTQIFSSVQLVNNEQVLGTPLQLYILTQILLDNKQSHQDLTENFFILTKMYKSFFEGRFKHCIEKFNLESPCPFVYDSINYLEQYEIAALRSMFDAEVLKDLRLDQRTNKTFLNGIEFDKDILGIIVKVENGKAIFEHYTYAEYFTSVFLFKNFENAKRLRELLFSDRYRNLMKILNIMLAEENPLHLAVIYRNFEQLELHFNDSRRYDTGGRNPLHIAVSLPSHSCELIQKEHDLPLKDVREKLKLKIEHARGVQRQDDDLDRNRNIIKKVLEKFDPHDHDCLFDKDSSYYAIVQKNLFAVDAILESYGMTEEVYKNLRKYGFISSPTIACYATLWGYPNLLSVTLDKKHSQVTNFFINSKDFLLQVCVDSTVSNKAQIIDLLIQYGFDETVLTRTVDSDDLHCSKTLLLENDDTLAHIPVPNCEVNGTSRQNKTDLSLAIQSNDLDAAKHLIENGADFNEEIKWESLKQYDPALIDLIRTRSDMLKNSDQCSLLLYAIRHQDEEFVEFLHHNAKLNFNNRQIVPEAMLCENTNILLLLDKEFQLHPEVNRILYSCLCESRKGELRNLKKKHKISLTDENLYIAFHLAVYLGDTDFVKEVLKEGIDFDSVDVYNPIYPLHFATKNRFLDGNLLIEKTSWIDQMYLDRRIWKLQHMRSYILKRDPLRIEDEKRKHKYPYLLNEYNVSAKVDQMRLKFIHL